MVGLHLAACQWRSHTTFPFTCDRLEAEREKRKKLVHSAKQEVAAIWERISKPIRARERIIALIRESSRHRAARMEWELEKLRAKLAPDLEPAKAKVRRYQQPTQLAMSDTYTLGPASQVVQYRVEMRGVEADIEALRKNHEIRMAELYKAAGLKPPRATRAEMQVGSVSGLWPTRA